MLETLNNVIVEAMDYVFGWMLFLPRDVMLFAVAILTSAALTFARIWTTDQDWLRRAADDKKRLAQLLKQAKRGKDKEAKQRHKLVINTIKIRSLRFEGKPLLVAIVPVALLGTWAWTRIAYVPPRAGETIEVRAYLPTSAIGGRAHIVPVKGLESDGGWTQRVVPDTYPQPKTAWERMNRKVTDFCGMTPPLEGVAIWKLKSKDPQGRYRLKIRYGGRTYGKDLLVGGRHYASALDIPAAGPVQAIELAMKPVRLFGVVGDLLFVPGWILAYLLIAIPFVFILRPVFKIY